MKKLSLERALNEVKRNIFQRLKRAHQVIPPHHFGQDDFEEPEYRMSYPEYQANQIIGRLNTYLDAIKGDGRQWHMDDDEIRDEIERFKSENNLNNFEGDE